MLPKHLMTVTGHPVDVSSGTFFTDEEDFFLTGPIPLSWERTWYSKSDYQGPLGNGWHHAYDMAIVLVDDDPLSDGGAHLHMDCWDIGIPTPHLVKKSVDNAASQKARSKYRNDKIDEMARNIKRSNPKITQAEAQRRATSYLKDKDALHEVDAIAGGNNKVVRMGDRGVNCSLESQWTKKEIADNIELQVRNQIRQMGYIVPPTTNLPSNLMMNVRL